MNLKTAIIICFQTLFISAQDSLTIDLLSETEPKTDSIYSIDNLQALYTLNNNTLEKYTNQNTYTYSNLQLGNVSKIDIFNPLKIPVFYKDFNTVVILDNRLSEVSIIDFNTIDFYRNVSQVSIGNDTAFWIFNQDTNELELFDYVDKTTRAKTLPITDSIIDITSDYNYVWVLTDKHIYQYNYFGSLIHTTTNDNYSKAEQFNENLIAKSEDKLIIIDKKTQTKQVIDVNNFSIKRFFVVGDFLYIYNGKILRKYQLKSN